MRSRVGVDLEITESTENVDRVNQVGALRVNRMRINGMELDWPLSDPPEVIFKDGRYAMVKLTLLTRSVQIHAEQDWSKTCVGTPIYNQLAVEMAL